MTDEEINIKIAEALGRVRRPDGFWYPPGKTIGTAGIPNYCDDLNAMHEAEKTLSEDQFEVYHCELGNMMPFARPCTKRRHVCSADARYRAEAFLRTLDLWTE